MKHRKQLGLSLIELLVALAIGGFLIIGAVTVQSQTRKTFTVNEQQARLQETARFVLSVIEPDVQLAGLYGYSNQADGVKWDTGGGRLITAVDMAKNKGALTGMPAVFDECGTNQVINVQAPIEADDGAWTLGCAAGGGGTLPGTDTLTVRRTGVDKVDPVPGRAQIYTSRLQPVNQRLIVNGVAPYAIEDKIAEVRDFIMHTYYVAQDSEGRPNLPAMRLKQISSKDGEGKWDDQELVRGVEDIQVELGVDPGDPNESGVIVKGDNGMATNVNGNVARYVKPGDAILATAQIATVRIWVRVRAEEPEPGFTDQRTYNYASVKNFRPADGFRRVVMSRTIFLRNSRPLSTS